MEEDLNMKKNHPSLPPNYVTLADLQQRWLKQQQENKEKEQQQQQQQQTQNLKQQDPHQRGEPAAVVVRTHKTAPVRSKQYQPKIRTVSGTNRGSVAGTRDQKADLDRKSNESKKIKRKEVKRNPNLEEKKNQRGKSEGSEISEIEAKKSTIENESNEKKNESKKIKKKIVKRNPKLEEEKNERGKSEGSEISETVAKKSAMESESNEKKNGDDATVEQVEKKFGVLCMNSGNGIKNGRFKREKDGFRHYQSQRNGGRGYGYGDGHFGGGGFRRHYYEEQNQRGNKIWVRKDCNVGGEIET